MDSKCLICKKPVREKYAPFCSKRCADLDLGKWLGGEYIITSDEDISSDLEE